MRTLHKFALTAVTVVALAAFGASSASAGIVAPSTVGIGGNNCNVTTGGPTLLPPPNPKTTSIPANTIASSSCPLGVVSATNSTALSVTVDDTANTLTLNSGNIRVTDVLFRQCNITVAAPGVSIPRVGMSRRYTGTVTVPSAGISATGAACPTPPFTVSLDLLLS